MKRKAIAWMVTVGLLLSLTGCNGHRDNSGVTDADKQTVTVRYLNFKPEVASVYQEIAAAYEKETGRKVLVETAANNTYEQTLSAKMATSDAPTIFQVNGPRGYANWERYCADLTDTALYNHLTDPSLALTANDRVYGIPYVVEGYGIIYNNEIMERYFALQDRQSAVNSVEDIRSFEALKTVVSDMQDKKDALGIKGVFASTSLKPGEDWRWQTHLANVPIYQEFRDRRVDLSSNDTKTIAFTHADKFKNLFDLYLNHSTVDPRTLGTKIVDESMSEFALGECAMVQNGTWAWNQISAVEGNTIKESDIKYLPLYMGLDGEETQGLCIGTESFLCINSKADQAEQDAAMDFLLWLFSSSTGKQFVTDQLNFVAPFDTFDVNERPSDPLAKEMLRYLENEELTTIPWHFTVFPGQTFKDDFGAALLQYAQGTKSWSDVKDYVVKRWKEESALL